MKIIEYEVHRKDILVLAKAICTWFHLVIWVAMTRLRAMEMGGRLKGVKDVFLNSTY